MELAQEELFEFATDAGEFAFDGLGGAAGELSDGLVGKAIEVAGAKEVLFLRRKELEILLENFQELVFGLAGGGFRAGEVGVG